MECNKREAISKVMKDIRLTTQKVLLQSAPGMELQRKPQKKSAHVGQGVSGKNYQKCLNVVTLSTIRRAYPYLKFVSVTLWITWNFSRSTTTVPTMLGLHASAICIYFNLKNRLGPQQHPLSDNS